RNQPEGQGPEQPNPFATQAIPSGPAGAYVLLLDDAGRPVRSIEFTEAGLTIGRLPGSGLVLEAPTISRNHLRVDWNGPGARVTDLGSKSGSDLGGARLTPQTPARWGPGQILQIGPYRLALHTGAPPALFDPDQVLAAPPPPAVGFSAPTGLLSSPGPHVTI